MRAYGLQSLFHPLSNAHDTFIARRRHAKGTWLVSLIVGKIRRLDCPRWYRMNSSAEAEIQRLTVLTLGILQYARVFALVAGLGTLEENDWL